MKPLRVLLLGANGQIGYELASQLRDCDLHCLTRQEVDLSDAAALEQAILAASPQIVLNAAAYTAVDAAEGDSAAAFAVNADAPATMARVAREQNALLVHYSTDYVFDGSKPTPYVESDVPNPLGVYGASKLAGERAIAESGAAYLIFRTSWIYGARGKNFVQTMLRLASSGRELRVVDDQRGAPTSSAQVATATADILRAAFQQAGDDPAAAVNLLARKSGIYHMTAAGEVTWYGFADAIFTKAEKYGVARPTLIPISTEEFGAAARRPRNSVLSNAKLRGMFGIELGDWASALGEVLEGQLER